MVQSSKRWKVKPSLEMLLSNLPGMVYRCLNDEFWSMEFVSAGACRLTGYQPEDFLGEHRARYRDLVHRDDRERVAQEVQAALRADHSFQLTYRISTADRQQKWVWEQGNGIRDEKGNFYALEGYITDISYRMQAEEALRESEERLRLVTQATTDVIWDWDLGSDRIWWSPGVQNMYGFSYAEVNSGKAWINHIAPEERERVRNCILAVINGKGENWTDEYHFLRKDGSSTYVLDRGFVIRDRGGKAVRMVGAMVDITQSKQAEHERLKGERRNRFLASLLDKAQDSIVVADMKDRIFFWNKGAERLFGWTAREAIGKTKRELVIIDPAQFDEASHTVLGQGDWSGELRKRRKDGSKVMVESHWTLVRDDNEKPQSVLAIETDITHRKAAERAIEDLAFFDPLTRLPNRRLLLDRLQHALATSRRTHHAGALLFIDLDNFKSLNDTLGHDKGDLLLQHVARRLETCVPRKSDTVARLGGDEFVVMLEDLSENREDAATQAESVGEKILTAFNQSFRLNSHEYHTTPSIGITLFDNRISNIDELLKQADLAMYQAKAAGRNTIRFFDPDMQIVVSARVELESDLRQGLQQHQFFLHYQRQTDSDGVTIGVEALVRWRHPRRGLVSPALFIPLAEETGQILGLGQWVLETACRQIADWAKRPETSRMTVAVNVSARQFRQPDFVGQALAILNNTGADPQKLKLELTESLLVANVDNVVAKMCALKAVGVGFALDDFGTGYSSLSYLKRLPLDQLKIDQSFVRDVLTDPNDAAIARTILVLGQSLGLDIIAEGVETADQRDFLAQHGCHIYQGYFFGRPLPAEHF